MIKFVNSIGQCANRPFAGWLFFNYPDQNSCRFSFIFKFDRPIEVYIAKALICTRKQNLGVYKREGEGAYKRKFTVVDFRFQMSCPKYNPEIWEISSSVITWSNHCVLESSRSLRNPGNFMIYFCLMASLLNAILWDVGTMILSRLARLIPLG